MRILKNKIVCLWALVTKDKSEIYISECNAIWRTHLSEVTSSYQINSFHKDSVI